MHFILFIDIHSDLNNRQPEVNIVNLSSREEVTFVYSKPPLPPLIETSACDNNTPNKRLLSESAVSCHLRVRSVSFYIPRQGMY
jgi:hypothetical protein